MFPLSESDKFLLLALARMAIETAVREKRLPEAIPNRGLFSKPGRAFVTLRCRGRLRGCIGRVEPPEPLGECIVRSAVSAALEDPRFNALSLEELPGLQIEISLLTPPEPIAPNEIEIGRHGLMISRDGRRGLLLPQVAMEHGLTRERFLEETCRKAGIPGDAWKDPATQVYAFFCEIAAEDYRGGSKPPE